MLDSCSRPTCRDVGDGLVLRTLGTEAELDKPCAVNAGVHGAQVGEMLRALAVEHPDVAPRDVMWIEDAGRPVATVCAVPWRLSLSGVEFSALELGMVATLEGWRGRGLQRTLIDHFRERARERGALLSIVQGIPGFYRQFGYTYALPLEGGLILEHRQAPFAKHTFSFRKATPDDILGLITLNRKAEGELELLSLRSQEHWDYILRHAKGTATEVEVWLCEEDRQAVGYMVCPVHHFGEELVIGEAVADRADVGLAMLAHARHIAQQKGAPGIRLSVHEGSLMSSLGRSLGARDTGRYAWQVWCPDLRQFLDTLRPALDARLRDSAWANHTGDVPARTGKRQSSPLCLALQLPERLGWA